MTHAEIAAVLGRHPLAVLQFSGGRDSLAVLHLLRPWWHRIVVLWMNPGAPLPEVVEQMADVRALVPHFLEVQGNQPAQIAREGYPLDVVPSLSTAYGQAVTAGVERIRFQSFLSCCTDNLWRPMHEATLSLGATLIIRGQKDADRLRGPHRSGHSDGVVELLYPIEDWTDRDVADYLVAHGVALPAYYRDGLSSSPDCWDCTAYGGHGPERMRYLARRHPKKWIEIRPVLAAARAATRADAAWLDAALTEDA